jgi:universal stress protein E
MNPFKSILVATDLSADASNAVRRAALLAARHSACLTVLHVVNPTRSHSLRKWLSPPTDTDIDRVQARATLRRITKETMGTHGVAASFHVMVGDVLEEIVSHSEHSEHADLVVVGNRGTGSLKEFILGSTVDRLLGRLHKPLLVVKQANDGPYRRLLVPVDFGACSEAALVTAASLARNDGAINVFHARSSRLEFQMRRADVPAAVIRDYREKKQGGGSCTHPQDDRQARGGDQAGVRACRAGRRAAVDPRPREAASGGPHRRGQDRAVRHGGLSPGQRCKTTAHRFELRRSDHSSHIRRVDRCDHCACRLQAAVRRTGRRQSRDRCQATGESAV